MTGAPAAPRWQLLLYGFCRAVVAGFARVYFRATYDGRENIPATGAFILSPVHRSNVDTLVAAGLTRRRMRFLGKHSMWKFRMLGRFFDALGGIKVQRGTTDRESMRMCLDALEAGEPLVVYPEGRRRSGPVVEELFEGAAYMACRTGVPIVPIGIGGSEAAMSSTHRLPRPRRIHMIVGKPIEPPVFAEGRSAPRRAVRELNDELHRELQRLFDEAQRVA